jgi:hypothetical protein
MGSQVGSLLTYTNVSWTQVGQAIGIVTLYACTDEGCGLLADG